LQLSVSGVTGVCKGGAFGAGTPRATLRPQLKRVSLGRDRKETKMGTTHSRALSGIVGAFLLAFLVLPTQAYYIEITEPVEGATYSPCGPDTIFWESDIPASPGSPDDLRISYRSQGGSWHVIANDNNDGAHPWSYAPCYTGWYELRILYTPNTSVGDTVSFYVDGGTPPPNGEIRYIMYVDFDGESQYCSDVESRIDPPVPAEVSAYIGITPHEGGYPGLTTVSFRLSDLIMDCPGVVAYQSFTCLMPGGLMIGDPFDDVGVTVSSTTPIDLTHRDVFYIGQVDFLYIGGACDLLILDHADYPRWVVDSWDEVYPYCVWSHGGIAKNPVDGEPRCFPNNPVETRSWGMIKAMYRN